MPSASFSTVDSIVSSVSVELGLGAVSGDPFAATVDANVAQLVQLLNSLGRRLLLENNWLQTRKEKTYTATASQTSFTLPTDFFSYVDQTAWNRTRRLPLAPVSPQQWQALQAGPVATVLPILFRPQDGVLQLSTGAALNDVVAFEYTSTWWVHASGGTAPTKDSATATGDVLWIERQVLMDGLKASWLQAKGFDSSAALNDFDGSLAAAMARNAQAAPVLSLNGGQRLSLFGPNVPETGFGA